MTDEIISASELAEILGAPELRIFDCTTRLDYQPPGSETPYNAIPARDSFEAAHVPGADFLDIQGEFSDQATPLRFMLADGARLESTFGRHGIGEGARVILYSTGSPMWAARFWWMLDSLGFPHASVLDGGLENWIAEGRPIESGAPKGYPSANFTAALRPGRFSTKNDVLAAMTDPDAIIVNALGPQFHKGLEPSRYGRQGRIPGSVNVPAADLFDAANKAFVSLEQAERRFASQGVTKDKRVVAYCGGGISATVDLLFLRRLGYENLTLYDGSMGEWAKDVSLPIETD